MMIHHSGVLQPKWLAAALQRRACDGCEFCVEAIACLFSANHCLAKLEVSFEPQEKLNRIPLYLLLKISEFPQGAITIPISITFNAGVHQNCEYLPFPSPFPKGLLSQVAHVSWLIPAPVVLWIMWIDHSSPGIHRHGIRACWMQL